MAIFRQYVYLFLLALLFQIPRAHIFGHVLLKELNVVPGLNLDYVFGFAQEMYWERLHVFPFRHATVKYETADLVPFRSNELHNDPEDLVFNALEHDGRLFRRKMFIIGNEMREFGNQ